jgi:hypothetical protein
MATTANMLWNIPAGRPEKIRNVTNKVKNS